MKQKSFKYVLITAVALVWGLIIYRVIKGLGGDDVSPIAVASVKKIDYTAPVDSFALMADYGDPFQPSLTEEEEPVSGMNTEAPVTTPALPVAPPPPQFDFNTIQYHGMMSNPDSKKKIAILSISGKDYLVKEKEKIEGVTVRKITPDEIVVTVNGKTETVGKSRN